MIKQEIETSENIISKLKKFRNYIHLNRQSLQAKILNKSKFSIDFQREKEFLATIENNVFKNLKELKIIDFYYVESMEDDVFKDLVDVENLFLLRTDEIERTDDADGRRLKIKSNVDIMKIINTLKNLKSLSLHGWAIDSITADYFKPFSNLNELYLTDNKFNVLVETMFTGLDNLELLNLEDNDINDIQPFTFRSLKKLKDLTLSNNHLKTLNENVFYGLENLKHLYVCSNLISKINKNVFIYLTKLENLFLDSNGKFFLSLFNLIY
jgi:hypothetical protein